MQDFAHFEGEVTRIDLILVEGNRSVSRKRTISSLDGITRLAKLARRQKAKRFQDWAKGVLRWEVTRGNYFTSELMHVQFSRAQFSALSRLVEHFGYIKLSRQMSATSASSKPSP